MPQSDSPSAQLSSLYRYVAATRDAPGVVQLGPRRQNKWAFVNSQSSTVFVEGEGRELRISRIWGDDCPPDGPADKWANAFSFAEHLTLSRRSASRTLSRGARRNRSFLGGVILERGDVELIIPAADDDYERVARMSSRELVRYSGPLSVDVHLPVSTDPRAIEALKEAFTADPAASRAWGQVYLDKTLTTEERDKALSHGASDMADRCGFTEAFAAWASRDFTPTAPEPIARETGATLS